MKLTNSKLWLVSVAALSLAACSFAFPVAPAAAIVPAQSSEKMAPETIDGAKVNAKTQSMIAAASKKYTAAKRDNKSAERAAAFQEIRAVYEGDNNNLAAASWYGYALIEEGLPTDAIQVLERANGKSRSKAVNMMNARNLSVAYFSSKQYDDLIALVKGWDPSDVDAKTSEMVAGAYFAKKDYNQAVKAYQALEASGNLSSEGIRNLGVALIESGRAAESVDYLAKAAKSDPSNLSLAVAAASNVLAAGRAGEAIAILEPMTSVAGGDVTFANVLANAYAMRGGSGDLAKAVAAMGTKGEPTTVYNVGTLALQQQNYTEAVRLLARAAELRGDAKSYNNLGRAYEGAGDNKNAAANYVKASDLEPSDKVYAKNAAILLSKTGDARASSYATRSGETGAAFDMTQLQALVSAGKYTEAAQLLDQNESNYRDNAEFYFNKGVVLYRKGDLDGAVAAYRKSKALKEDAPTIKNLSIALYQKKDFTGAKAECDAYIAKVGRTPDALQNLGAVLAASGRTSEAIQVWRELLDKSDNVAVRLDLADALWNAGDTQGARYHYAAVLKVQGSNARALNGVGLYSLSQSKTRDAEASFRSAIASDPNFYPAYNNLAIALERLNRKSEARQMLIKALEVKPDFAEARRNLDRLGG